MPTLYTFSTTLTPDSSLLDNVLATLWNRPDTTNGSGISQSSEPCPSNASIPIGGLGGGHRLVWGGVSVGIRTVHGGDFNNAGLAFTVAKAGVGQIEAGRFDVNSNLLLNTTSNPSNRNLRLNGRGTSGATWLSVTDQGSTANEVLLGMDAASSTSYVYSTAWQLNINVNGSDRMSLLATGHVAAGADNAQTWGTASKRWSVVYAGTGSINTSDAREKTRIAPFSDDELAAARDLGREIGSFRFLSAMREKGDAARFHIGLTVQRAMEIMASHGLDPLRYGFICHDEWVETHVPAKRVERNTGLLDGDGGPLIEEVVLEAAKVVPGGDRYGFRVDELLLFLARGFEARLSALEAA